MREPLRVARGFSLLELLLVIAILLVLAGLTLPLMEMTEIRAREKILRESLRDTRSAIDRYRAERNSVGSPFPPCVASLTEPIPTALLKTLGNPGPFLGNLPQNSFADQHDVFSWMIRDAVTGAWMRADNPRTTLPNGVYDIKVPDVGEWKTAIDGSNYADW